MLTNSILLWQIEQVLDDYRSLGEFKTPKAQVS